MKYFFRFSKIWEKNPEGKGSKKTTKTLVARQYHNRSSYYESTRLQAGYAGPNKERQIVLAALKGCTPTAKKKKAVVLIIFQFNFLYDITSNFIL